MRKSLASEGRAVGMTFNNDEATTGTNRQDTLTEASVSLLHDSGLGATVAYASQELSAKTSGTKDPEGWYAKVGYQWNAWGFAADYASFDNGNVSIPSTSTYTLSSIGLGADYDLGQGVVVGGLYRNYSADVSGINNESDINVLALNMRVKF